MAQVQELGRVNPELQGRLLAELSASDPSLWPLAVQNFRSRVAYSQEREQAAAAALAQAAPATIVAWPPRQETAAGQPPATPAPSAGPPGNPGSPQPAQPRVARLPATEDAALPPRGPSSPASSPPQASSGDAPTGPGESKREVVTTSYAPRETADAQESVDWRASLDAAIARLEKDLDARRASGTDVSDEARLRLLRLAAGRRDAAVEPIPGAPPAVADFWSKTFFALDALLDEQRTPQAQRRATESRHHLAAALASLGEVAAIEIRNLALCSDVQSYGSIKRFEKYEFAPGAPVLLYAEVENFQSEPTAKGYHTAMAISYQIFDAAGRRVAQQEPKTIEEDCQNPRRDYFISCNFSLPKRIYPGRHTLKLTIEDLQSKKVGESSVEFTIK